jgi:hypothetical protein
VFPGICLGRNIHFLNGKELNLSIYEVCAVNFSGLLEELKEGTKGKCK